MLRLHNHIQICNSYTMSMANRNDDEGNLKLQRPTYLMLRVTTKYAFDHTYDLIQSYLPEMNMYEEKGDAKSQHKDLSGHYWNDSRLVPGIFPEDSSQGLGVSHG